MIHSATARLIAQPAPMNSALVSSPCMLGNRNQGRWVRACVPAAEAEGITAHHPGAVGRDVAPQDGSKAEAYEQDHRRTRQKPDGVKDRAVTIDGRIELGHPQAREGGDKPTRDQNPPGSAVRVGFAAAETGGELEGAEDAVDGWR